MSQNNLEVERVCLPLLVSLKRGQYYPNSHVTLARFSSVRRLVCGGTTGIIRLLSENTTLQDTPESTLSSAKAIMQGIRIKLLFSLP